MFAASRNSAFKSRDGKGVPLHYFPLLKGDPSRDPEGSSVRRQEAGATPLYSSDDAESRGGGRLSPSSNLSPLASGAGTEIRAEISARDGNRDSEPFRGSQRCV